MEAMEAMATMAVRSARLTQLSWLSNTLHPPQLSHPQFLTVLVKIFWPPLRHIFIPLNIKQPKLFLVPSLLGPPLLAMPVRNLMHHSIQDIAKFLLFFRKKFKIFVEKNLAITTLLITKTFLYLAYILHH